MLLVNVDWSSCLLEWAGPSHASTSVPEQPAALSPYFTQALLSPTRPFGQWGRLHDYTPHVCPLGEHHIMSGKTWLPCHPAPWSPPKLRWPISLDGLGLTLRTPWSTCEALSAFFSQSLRATNSHGNSRQSPWQMHPRKPLFSPQLLLGLCP